MSPIKTTALFAFSALLAAPALADAEMHDYKAHLYDADYEVVLAEYGYVVGQAVFGQNDADYDAFISSPTVFASAQFGAPALGQYDADYEAALASQGILVGAALYGKYDADYEAYLTPEAPVRAAELALPAPTLLASR